MIRVIAFGSFDPFHEGHRFFLRRAKELGEELIVVVARDEAIRRLKHRDPFLPEKVRLNAVRNLSFVDEVMLGDEDPTRYQLFKKLQFDVLALGYDQRPSRIKAVQLLEKLEKHHVAIKRLPAFHPTVYKSSLLRERDSQIPKV